MAKAPDPGEANWRKIKATVKPLRGKGSAAKSPSRLREGLGVGLSPKAPLDKTSPPPTPPASGRGEAKSPPSPSREGPAVGRRSQSATSTRPTPTPPLKGRGLPATPLAHDWERTLRTGRAQPDMVIDLHGHNLASAHSHLSRALDRAAASHARIILVIAGKARGSDEAPRGAIRRELATWLAHSHHAGRILAVRNAHPRHGGAGAVYLVLRK